MALTIEQKIEILEEAIASGVKRVEYDDKEIEYQSTAAMLKALAFLKRQQAGTAGILTSDNPPLFKGL
jgi:hypothetical protein